MAYYIKVTPRVAQVFGRTEDRAKTKDGNYLLWQADIDSVVGATIFDRAAAVGGVALTAREAKAETKGVDNPAYVYTPEAYMENPSNGNNNIGDNDNE